MLLWDKLSSSIFLLLIDKNNPETSVRLVFDKSTYLIFGESVELNKSHNMLTSLSPAVAELRKLWYLDLSFNHISEVDPNLDTNLINLKEFNLGHNEISVGLFTLQAFRELENLDLSFNKLLGSTSEI
jgi:Leucine-rich repeat (LRR) protein